MKLDSEISTEQVATFALRAGSVLCANEWLTDTHTRTHTHTHTQGRTQELTEGVLHRRGTAGRIQEFALGGAPFPPLPFLLPLPPDPYLPLSSHHLPLPLLIIPSP